MYTYFKNNIEPLSKELDKLLRIKRIPVQYIETDTRVAVVRNEYIRDMWEIYFFEPNTNAEAPF